MSHFTDGKTEVEKVIWLGGKWKQDSNASGFLWSLWCLAVTVAFYPPSTASSVLPIALLWIRRVKICVWLIIDPHRSSVDKLTESRCVWFFSSLLLHLFEYLVSGGVCLRTCALEREFPLCAWKSGKSLWVSVLSFHHVLPEMQLKSSGLVTSAVTHCGTLPHLPAIPFIFLACACVVCSE